MKRSYGRSLPLATCGNPMMTVRAAASFRHAVKSAARRRTGWPIRAGQGRSAGFSRPSSAASAASAHGRQPAGASSPDRVSDGASDSAPGRASDGSSAGPSGHVSVRKAERLVGRNHGRARERVTEDQRARTALRHPLRAAGAFDHPNGPGEVALNGRRPPLGAHRGPPHRGPSGATGSSGRRGQPARSAALRSTQNSLPSTSAGVTHPAPSARRWSATRVAPSASSRSTSSPRLRSCGCRSRCTLFFPALASGTVTKSRVPPVAVTVASGSPGRSSPPECRPAPVPRSSPGGRRRCSRSWCDVSVKSWASLWGWGTGGCPAKTTRYGRRTEPYRGPPGGSGLAAERARGMYRRRVLLQVCAATTLV